MNHSDQDLLERTLVQSFTGAHEEPRWAGTTWPDPLGRVRRAHRVHTRRVAAVCAVATAGLVGGVVSGFVALQASGDQVRVTAPAAQGGTGSGTGLDWLLTKAQYDDYTAAHPSPSPVADRVPSPAPMNDVLQTLQANVTRALPGDAHSVRADAADGGQRDHAVVWQRLADGTPVVTERYRLTYPVEAAFVEGPRPTAAPDGSPPDQAHESFTPPTTWADGTAYTVLTGDLLGYGIDANTQWSGPIVWTVTADGWFTMWTAPVSADRLLGWAQAADAQFVAAQ